MTTQRARGRRFAVALSVTLALACRSPDPPAGRETVVDLVASLFATDSAPATERVLLDQPDARRHLVKGWDRGEMDEHGALVRLTGTRATVSFHAGATPVDQTLVMRWSMPIERRVPGTLLVRLNARPIGRVRLDGDPAEHQVLLPATGQTPGWNALDFMILGAGRRGAHGAFALRALAFEPHAVRPPAPAALDGALVLPRGATVTYFIRVPGDARLVIDAGDLTAVRADVEADGLTARALHVEVGGGLDLRPEAGRVARLTLSADAAVTLRGARVEGRRMAHGADEALPRARHANVILYVADTLRADRLGCYGYTRGTSPRLDAFAAEGLLFTNTLAASSWTRPSVASMLTGVHPPEHGATALMDAIAADVPTLPERLRAGGYTTAAFVTNLNVAARFGFGRGFDEFRYLEERDDRDTVYASAEELNAAVFPWLEAHAARRFFLYVHASDTHAPYRPPRDYAARYVRHTGPPTAASRGEPGRFVDRPERVSAEDAALLSDLYDAEVAFLDARFGALLDRLEHLSLARSTLIVFVADHGEEFSEHGGFDHGRTLYQEVTRVPLILRFPDRADAGRRVSAIVRHVDVAPTILAVVGLHVPADLVGLPVSRSAEASTREAFLSTELGGRNLAGVVVEPWKAVWDAQGGQLFDLANDPGETRDVAADHPLILAYARQAATRWRLRSVARPVEDTAVVDPATERRLRALGYVGAGE